MIHVNNLKKSFGTNDVLKGISISLEKGKTNLIIGQSGSGKTVFLKNLLGLFAPTSGEILFNGRNQQKMDFKEQQDLRKEIGVVFQGSALFDSLTVEQNIMFPLEMYTDLSKEEMLDKVNQVINRVNLNNANQKFPSEISGGMQKRVAIARAIVMGPKYLFCDEPNSGLDPKTAIVIDQLIQEITKEYNTTTVINTHDMNSVLEIGEKIVFLKNGYLAWEGNNQEILTTDNQVVNDYVYSSELMKKIKISLNS